MKFQIFETGVLMRRFCLALLLCLSFGLTASADIFHLTFTSLTGGGDVLLTGSQNVPGQYLITSATGSIDGFSIIQLLAPGSYPSVVANDNLLNFPLVTNYIDLNGLSFSLAGGELINLYFSAGYRSQSILAGVETFNLLEGFSVAPPAPPAVTPEPSSLVLLGTGVLGLVATMRRRLA